MPRLGDRSLFPELEVPHYLNHAAMSPLSAPAKQAMLAMLEGQARVGVAGIGDWLEALFTAKAAFAELVGVGAADVAFVPNTSAGVTAVALCRPWVAGEGVLVFGGEFPTNMTPWQRAAELFGLRVRTLPAWSFWRDPDAALAAVAQELDRGVRLVAVSAVQFQSGLRMPVKALAALCHSRGAELFVDGIQACGVVPLDVGAWGVDYLAVGGHKWLGGTFGTGFLAVRPDRWAALRPHLASWLSHVEGMAFLSEGPGHLRADRGFVAGPSLFEGGAFNAVGAAALGASITMLNTLGVAAIAEHVGGVLDDLEAGLVSRGFESLRSARLAQRSGILAVRCPEGSTAEGVAPALASRGVSVSTPDGNLRFSPHWHNDRSQVPAILAALDDVPGPWCA